MQTETLKTNPFSTDTQKGRIARELARTHGFTESKFKVYETYDYEIFNFLDYNRDIDENRVKKIADEILKKGLLFSPIIVNENLEFDKQ